MEASTLYQPYFYAHKGRGELMALTYDCALSLKTHEFAQRRELAD